MLVRDFSLVDLSSGQTITLPTQPYRAQGSAMAVSNKYSTNGLFAMHNSILD